MPASDSEQVPTAVRSALADVHSALVVSESEPAQGRALARQVIAGSSLSRKSVLHVSIERTPQEIFSAWYRPRGTFPDRLAIVTPADTTRSTSARPDDGTFIRYPYIATVDDPGDLQTIGSIAVRLFERWESDTSRVEIDVSGLAALLAARDREVVFQFLHLFRTWAERMDARCLFRLDGSAVDDATELLVRDLFETVVRVDETGIAVV